jgi:hypothetical protein
MQTNNDTNQCNRRLPNPPSPLLTPIITVCSIIPAVVLLSYGDPPLNYPRMRSVTAAASMPVGAVAATAAAALAAAAAT